MMNNNLYIQKEYSDNNVIIALVANKADLVDEDDQRNGYGRYDPQFNYPQYLIGRSEVE